jgi:hypothetical protein
MHITIIYRIKQKMSELAQDNQELNNQPGLDITALDILYESTDLIPNKIHEIPEIRYGNGEQHAMATCANYKEGIYQSCRAIIMAGKEFFSVIDVHLAGQPEFSVVPILAHHIDGERSEIISILEKGRRVNVGRNYQNWLGTTTSREHFSLALDTNNTIGIIDNKSTNGTKVWTAERDDVFGLKPQDQEHTNDIEDPLVNIDCWSVKSPLAKQKIIDNDLHKQ